MQTHLFFSVYTLLYFGNLLLDTSKYCKNILITQCCSLVVNTEYTLLHSLLSNNLSNNEILRKSAREMYITGIISHSVIADRRWVTQHLVTTITLSTNIFHVCLKSKFLSLVRYHNPLHYFKYSLRKSLAILNTHIF